MKFIRNILRDRWFKFLQQSLNHAQGKLAITDSLAGLLYRDQAALADIVNQRPPYADLAKQSGPSSTGVEHDAAARDDVIFITGRFRSGSTLLWNLFRQLKSVTAFYEPLNERRWFDPQHRGQHVDATHQGVTNYWLEYNGLEQLGKVFNNNWHDHHLYMDGCFWDGALREYISRLIEHAPGYAVLQFNRVDFRLPWLKKYFPKAKIVHLMRHPRDQWCSTLGKSYTFGPQSGSLDDFTAHDNYYLRIWIDDLRHQFPFLADEIHQHPYRSFYFLWKLSYLFAAEYADCFVKLEELLEDPKGQLHCLFEKLDLPVADWQTFSQLVAPVELGKWTKYASQDWFQSHEAHCEEILNQYFHVGIPDKLVASNFPNAIPLKELINM